MQCSKEFDSPSNAKIDLQEVLLLYVKHYQIDGLRCQMPTFELFSYKKGLI